MKRILILLVVLLSGCAQQATKPPAASTTLGTDDLQSVVDAVVGLCVQRGGTVHDASRNMVLCSKPLDNSFNSIMYRALMTESYASNPEVYVSFSVYSSGSKVGVAVRQWVEHQNVWGKTTKRYLDDEAALREQRQLLAGLSNRFRDPSSTQLQTVAQQRKEKAAPVGTYTVVAEKLASGFGCDGVEFLSGKPPVELYETSCPGGEIRVVRCEWSNCAVLQ